MTGGRRVAQVICTDAFAGAERYVCNLAGGLSARGWEVTVIGGNRTRVCEELPAAVTWHRGATFGSAARVLLRERPFDIVHAHMTAAELSALLASPLLRAPVVATRHFAQTRGSSAPARLLGRALNRHASAQLAISRFVADRTEGESVIVAPGTPDMAGAPAADGRDRSVLVAQRLEPEKRTDLALRAWQSSGLAGDGWRLDLAGGGQELEALRRLATELGVAGSCHFLGPVRDVGELQRRASLFLAPRPDEPYGLSVVEAMAAGLPVVAAAGGGHLETVGTVPDAALYPPDDVAAAGRLLADLARDPARRDRYGSELRAAHRRAFSIDAQVSGTTAVYDALLGTGTATT